MLKKILSSALALCMVFGTAAVLPEGAVSLGSQIEASAEEYGDFEYKVLDNGTVSITGYKKLHSATEVEIPDTINGKKVTEIGNMAFASQRGTEITGIVLPDTLKVIGSSAFTRNRKLQQIELPESLVEIGDNAFDLTGLTSVHIGKNVSSIGVFAFSECPITEMTVDPENKYFEMSEGILYEKGLAKLKFCSPEKTQAVISDKTTEIEEGAFFCCTKITSIDIPASVKTIGRISFGSMYALKYITLHEGLTNIGYGAFSGCAATEIAIPKSVVYIGEACFNNCPDLTIRHYHGSVAETYAINNEIKHQTIVEDGSDKNPSTGGGVGDITMETASVTLSQTSYTYDGKAKKPDVTVRFDAVDVPAEYYTVSYKNNTNAGTATVTVTGCGMLTGSTSKTFRINKASIAKAKITGLSNKTYTGKAIKQTPVVKLGGKTLKAGTDYTVSYKNNKAVGTATVTITGKGNYTGSAKADFRIAPKKTTLKKATSPKTKKLKVTYSKVSGVTGYQITYSTSKKFTKKTTKSVNVKGTSKTISNLKKGKTYYVKVRTYKTVGKTKYYSGYSKVRKIKVK